MRGFDVPIAVAHVLVPTAVTFLTFVVLDVRPDPVSAIVVWTLTALATRSAVWAQAAVAREERDPQRAEAYRERRAYTAATSFVAAAVLGIMLLDGIPIPAAPLRGPHSGFVLGAVALYMMWVSRRADLPGEVRDGWRGLLGKG